MRDNAFFDLLSAKEALITISKSLSDCANEANLYCCTVYSKRYSQNKGKTYLSLPSMADGTNSKSAGRQLAPVTENQMCTFSNAGLSAEQQARPKARVADKITQLLPFPPLEHTMSL